MMEIPYNKPSIHPDDIKAVSDVLSNGHLATGKIVEEFEEKLQEKFGTEFVCFSSGTAALYAMYKACGVGPDRPIVTSPLTFIATANAATALGARVILIDVDSQGQMLDHFWRGLKLKKKEYLPVLVPVDYAGFRKEYETRLPNFVVRDACHSFGNPDISDDEDAQVYSFHAVKTITTGEGGAVACNNQALIETLRSIRSHGIHRQYGTWNYAGGIDWGLNLRMTDIQAALGISQLNRLEEFLDKRREVALVYEKELEELDSVDLMISPTEYSSTHHLVPVLLQDYSLRNFMYKWMHYNGIRVQVHYKPLHFYHLYRDSAQGSLTNSEDIYSRVLSLPCYPDLSNRELEYVIDKFFEGLSIWRSGNQEV